MPRRSAFRGPEAKTYQLLHRSLRDPEINNPEASERVLSEVVKGKGKARDLQTDLSAFADLDIRENEGEAANYGILYDDSDYDYMQHLRSTGTSREAVFVEAPTRQTSKRKEPLILPEEALPAHPDDERDYNELAGISDRPFGLQPDMDPRLRETLEALDDDAFVDREWVEEGEDGDDYFDQLVGEGEEMAEDEWEDEEVPPLARLDRLQAASPTSDIADLESEAGDTIAELAASNAKRPPRPPASQASGFSMSSSSMFRSNGLQNLDEQFDEIEKEYAESGSGDGSLDDEDPDVHDFALFDPTEKRSDLDALMDEFLSRYDVLGGKLRPVFEGATPAAKLETLRRELREGTVSDGLAADEKTRISALADMMARRQASKTQSDFVPIERYEDRYDRWDCETILSTYSNLENHPRLLSAKGFVEKRQPRIRLDPRTGLPTTDSALVRSSKPVPALNVPSAPPKQTVTRSRDETAEERKQRKQQVRAERQERRAEKKTTKTTFEDERRRQQRKTAASLISAADVGGHEGGPTVIKLS